MLRLPHWMKPARKRPLPEVTPATKNSPPIIETQWGPVTEWARLQAASNIKNDPKVRERVLELLTRQCNGDAELALARMKVSYPEAFE